MELIDFYRVKESKVKCGSQWTRAYDCLKNNFNAIDSADGICSGAADNFANCK